MNLSDLNHLRNLSWYTTIPLLVCAWMLQDAPELVTNVSTLIGMLIVVGKYFLKVLVWLGLAYSCWLYATIYIESLNFPLTSLLANFLLTLACVGLGIYIIKPDNIVLPINFLWFAACASVSFNLYQIHNNLYGENSQSI